MLLLVGFSPIIVACFGRGERKSVYEYKEIIGQYSSTNPRILAGLYDEAGYDTIVLLSDSTFEHFGTLADNSVFSYAGEWWPTKRRISTRARYDGVTFRVRGVLGEGGRLSGGGIYGTSAYTVNTEKEIGFVFDGDDYYHKYIRKK
jgi:hypothetical protein